MMDDVYQYPVFFECHSLSWEQKKGIEKYLGVRRRSGGGDCGPLRRVNENVYSVTFRYQEDQQRVLQRPEHVVEFPGGRLVFTLRDSLEPHTSSPTTTSTPNQDLPGPAQSLQSIPASTALPCGEEYELRPDTYLLCYLKECPQAQWELRKELASVACSAQLYPEEGRVLVRSLAQPGAAGEGRNWKAEVDKLLDGYLCHYEVDPHKVKALLQSCSSGQTTDKVKVYSEGGLAVVVGKCSQVKARLRDVEDLTVKHRRSRLTEKQTRICRLGEAKLCLLWKEIEHGLGQFFPGVKVTQGEAGQVVLIGSVEDILEAGEWISNKEHLVLERTVSNMSPHLSVFLKKTYGGPGVLGDFLGVGDRVQVDLRDIKLHLFSLSVDNLDNAEKALWGEFKEVKIEAPNCSSLSSELKSKTNEMNQGQCRVQVLFGSDSTVRLLGHTKEVEELSEAVTQFILQRAVHLPVPEFAQELPEFLLLHGFDYSGDTFHPLTSSSRPMVVLDGPFSKVTEVRNRLGPFLDSLLQDTVPTDQLASLSLTEGNTVVASYSLCDGLQVLVCQGDITKQEADALVNAANEDLDHCGGVAAALSKAGGPDIQSESNTLVKYIGKIHTGDVVVTTGGNLKCKKLLHAVGPVAGKAGGKEKLLLEKAVNSALNLSEIMEFKSIAIPCISSGVFGVPVTVCSEAIVTAVKEFGSQEERSLSRIILIDNRGEVVRAMQEACDRLLQRISPRDSMPSGIPTGDLGFQMDDGAPDAGKEAMTRGPGNGVHFEVVQGTIETQQVDALVSPMVGHDPLSTRDGNTLYRMVGSQLTARFSTEAGEEMAPSDAVLVEDLPGLPSNAVFFLNLIPWDDDEDGTAAQVLRAGINNILTSCEKTGFGSVALPALGVEFVPFFPVNVVANIVQEEVQKFEQNRASRTPFLVRIAIYPNDHEDSEVFKDFTKEIHQPDQMLTSKRIVLLGKTGSGKSNLANTIFGEAELFATYNSPNSGTTECRAETRTVKGRSITLIDTPGFFDSERSEEDIKPEIMSCITECAPGPHAFFIVLKVDRFTEHEQAVITKILQYFSEDALKYAVVVFTHGEDLTGGKTIQEFVSKNKNLSDLVKKCGGRCHVFDNKHWNKQQNNYRSNQFQVEDLLNTVDKMVMKNNGGYYTNMVLQEVEEEIKKEEEQIKQSSEKMPQEVIRQQAKANVSNRFLIQLAGTATGAVLGAFFGVAALVGLVITAVRNVEFMKSMKSTPAVAMTAAAVGGGGGEVALAAAGAAAGAVAVVGGVVGGVIGYKAAKGAERAQDAAEMAANAVIEKGKTVIKWK